MGDGAIRVLIGFIKDSGQRWERAKGADYTRFTLKEALINYSMSLRDLKRASSRRNPQLMAVVLIKD